MEFKPIYFNKGIEKGSKGVGNVSAQAKMGAE